MKAAHLTGGPRGQRIGFALCLFFSLMIFGCNRVTPDVSASRSSSEEAAPPAPVPPASDEKPSADVDLEEGATSTTPESGASGTGSYLPLVGRWVRTDSPYVIEIRGVGRDGSMEAAYFNPNSIHVSRAMARHESGELQVFVELRDVNYPGATYNLVYNRAQDSLQGVYFQPALGQGFDVSFARVAVGGLGP
jgi:hypothetical protein